MTAFADTVRFCFPASLPRSDLPSYSQPELDHGGERITRGTAKMTAWRVMRSYAPDWILALVLWGVLAILNRTPGHKREFSLTDTTIQHSFAEHERVPPVLLAIVSVGIPFAVLVPLSALVSRNKWDVHNSILGLFMSYTMAGVVTQVVKMTVGRPRPDLISRCLPAPGATDHPVFGLSTSAICTTTNKLLLDDGFKSFPSGHSSLSFAGLGFLSCYLAGKMHLWDQRGHRTRAWFALAPLLGGGMVAISRTEDNRHHWQDVLVGSILGLFIAWVSYRTYYPPLSHPHCHLPLAPRTPGEEDDDGTGENGDEEQGRNQRVRLILEEGAAPRASEEEVAWRATQS